MSDLANENIPFGRLKRFRQSTGSYCGPATLQMLLSNFGVEVKQKHIAEAGSSLARVDTLGMSAGELAKAVSVLAPDLSFWLKRDATLFDLEKVVRKHKYPAGIDWQGFFEESEYGANVEYEDDGSIGDAGHYCAVTDIDLEAGYIRLADPYGHFAGKDRFFTVEVFDERWWDDRMELIKDGEDAVRKYTFESHLMFVLLPKEVRFPEEIGMKEV